MKHTRFFLFLTILVLASLACGLFGGAGRSAGAGEDNPSTGGGAGDADTELPVPAAVENYSELGDGSINYQTSLGLNEVMDFYREELSSAGYEERDLTTVTSDTTFSMVWDGHPSGQAIVVQGVDLGDGMTNVNLRFEDI